MKFSQLQIGQHFIFQDEPFTKASPVLATHDTNGERKFFKRADNVQLAQQQSDNVVQQPGAVDAGFATINEAFSSFHQAVREVLVNELNAEQYERIDKQIDEYIQVFHDAVRSRSD